MVRFGARCESVNRTMKEENIGTETGVATKKIRISYLRLLRKEKASELWPTKQEG